MKELQRWIITQYIKILNGIRKNNTNKGSSNSISIIKGVYDVGMISRSETKIDACT
jgi:hypothetical protein